MKAREAAKLAVKWKHNLYKNIICENYKLIAPAVATMGQQGNAFLQSHNH